MKKKLLIFAHRGEARAFFSKYTLKAMPFTEGLYESAECYLLITGEGPWKAGPKLALVLGKLANEIDSCINLGIAGALRSSIETGKIYPIRTCFLEQNSEMQFASHQLSPQGLDLITCHTRVLDPDLAKRLDNFSPLVDRELWSLAQVSTLSGHKISAYKLISDMVGETEICQRVKEKSDQFSALLLDFYSSLSLDQSKNAPQNSIDPNWEGFYFTTSLRNQRDALLDKISIKFGATEQALKQVNQAELLELEITPKARAILLIDKMRSILNPVQKKLQTSLDDLSIDLASAGANIKFPRDFEKASFHLSAHIEKAADLVLLIKAMEDFNYPKLIELIEGKDLSV